MGFVKDAQVRFVRKPHSPSFVQHFELTKEFLDLGKKYTVEHVFAGDPAQIELKGITSMLFMQEMFDLIEDNA